MRLKNIVEAAKKSATVKSSLKNTVIKPLTIIINVLYTPLLLDYLGTEKYGLWATILSLISWINFCDIGIGNGLRNLLTRKLTEKKYDEAKSCVSTAYIVLTITSSILLIILVVVSLLVNWNDFLNTNVNMTPVMIISFSFIAINFVLGLGKSILFALQLSEDVALINFLAVLIQLIGVLILKKIVSGNLIYIAILFGASSSIVYIDSDVKLAKKHEYFTPSISSFERKMVRSLFNMGILFLLLQLGGIIMSSTDNILLSMLYGPAYVTPYNTVTKFYSGIESVFLAMIAPIWSRTTEAITNKNYHWIRKTIQYINIVMGIVITGMLVSIFIYPTISKIWLGQELAYVNYIIPISAICSIFEMMTMTYSSILNGMGLLKMQAIIAVFQSIANIPFSILLATKTNFGMIGIKIATMLLFLFSAIFYYFYLIINLKKEENKKL